MKEYMISLDFVTTTSVTSSQLSKLIGIEETYLTSRVARDDENILYWRFEPSDDEDIELAAGVELLISSSHIQNTIKLDENIIAIYLSIGVLCDSYTCTTNLSLPSLAPLIAKIPELAIEIVAYPTNFEYCEEEEA